jgi:phosphoglycerate dehydrogenase-like enzyme
MRVAVGPDHAPSWLSDAVVAGGGQLVDVSDAEAIVWGDARQPAALRDALGRASGVRWVQLPFAGIENFIDMVDDCRIWTCGKGVYAEPVAEHALALSLAGLRHISGYSRLQAWSGPVGRNLLGANVTIVGGGGITESLVRLLGPFDCRVTVVRRTIEPMAGVATVVGTDDLHHCLVGADLVVLALALTPSTIGLMSAVEFGLMEPHAWLVNVARGRHVVTDDLVSALTSGEIGGAALDVTDPEPLPIGHPLWSLPNCIISPHVGNTPEMAVPLLSERVATNVRLMSSGLEPIGRIDPAVGY